MMRRVRSSKCGQTERNFRFNSDRVFTSAKHNAMTPRLIPLFIYSALVPCFLNTVTYNLLHRGSSFWYPSARRSVLCHAIARIKSLSPNKSERRARRQTGTCEPCIRSEEHTSELQSQSN